MAVRAVRGGRTALGENQALAHECLLELEAISRRIRDPAAKLRFVRDAVERYAEVQRAVARVPSPLLRRMLLRFFGLERLRRIVLGWEAAQARGMVRRTAWIASAAVLAIAIGIGGLSRAGARAARPAVAAAVELSPAEPQATAPTGPVAERVPSVAEAQAPKQVWRVETGLDYELYSNGLRLELAFASTHTPRHFRTFGAVAGAIGEPQQRPVGVLFHTSESDIWPMEAAYNESLRESSQALMRYIRRLHLYNFVIDRFGRVYRVVSEEHKANHAGNSVWQRDDEVFLNLNNAFLGVCFETRWEGGLVLPITQAQLSAGRLLTEYLRQRWEIPPEMCVTHGLTSVNPKKHLIGHHVDWARGFPFEAFGLPDQYAVAAPSVALFGFGYDDDFVKVMGEPWPGVRTAEAQLAQDAVVRGVTLDELRRNRQERYHSWVKEQTRDEEQSTEPRGRARQAKGASAAGGRAGS